MHNFLSVGTGTEGTGTYTNKAAPFLQLQTVCRNDSPSPEEVDRRKEGSSGLVAGAAQPPSHLSVRSSLPVFPWRRKGQLEPEVFV